MMLDTTQQSTRAARLLATQRVQVKRWILVIEAGPGAGTKHGPLGDHTMVGREEWCDVCLADPHVSKRHCELSLAGNGVRLHDIESMNGTFFGGIRVFDVLLGPEARFRIGDTTLRLELEEGSQSVYRRPTDPSGTLVGSSAPMQRLFGVMARVAPRDIPVLLLGETGTGKTAAARTMHALGPRAHKPFIGINCAAIPAELVESTLFGHVRGAFTGAHRSSAGVFEQAEGGSVLLDEIGDMPLALQSSLLSVLETRRVRRVGAEVELPVDFRLFCATNRNLPKEATAGRFRLDLYYRIAGIDLVVPPLRERLDDLPVLVEWFVARAVDDLARLGHASSVRGVADDALALLERHSWPGNVRELENVLTRAVALAETDLIEACDIVLSTTHLELDGDPVPATVQELSEGDSNSVAGTQETPDRPMTFRAFKAELLERHERAYFERLLAGTGGNISRAAQAAGLSRTYLKLALRKYGLISP